jgi:dimethylargininase
MHPVALLREVSPSIADCELTHVERQPIDVERARAQHRVYRQALERAGYATHLVDPLPLLPDAVFVEDTAVVLDEIAILTRPGAASRRAEVDSVGDALRQTCPRLPLAALLGPGTLDGGDVLRFDRTLYVGSTPRTTSAGREEFAQWATPHGYVVVPIAVRGCLHLKTAVTEIAPGILLGNPDWVDARAFGEVAWVDVDPDEPMAANALLVDRALIYPAGFPKTLARIDRALVGTGIELFTVDADELAKAEGGVTCCSLVIG